MSLWWMWVVAFAGAPKALTLVPEDRVVLVPTPAAGLTAHALCVRYREVGAAEVYACPEADALFSGSREGLATSLALPPTAHDLLGLALGGPPGVGGWVAVDAHLVAEWRYGRASVSSLHPDQVSGLSAWCAEGAGDGLVVELTTGCARRVDLGRAPAGGLVKVKDLASRFVGSDNGEFATEGSKAPTCSGEPQAVLARVLSKGAVCSGEVWPLAIDAVRGQLATFKASPDAVDGPVRAVFGDLSQAAAVLDDIGSRAGTLDRLLAEGQLGLAGAREVVLGANGSDARFVSLLTRLDQLDADLAELVVASGSLQERRAALQSELGDLREKAASPGLDGELVSRLGAALRDLVSRATSLRDETGRLEGSVFAAQQGIGFLQGAVEATGAPTKAR